MDMVCSYLYSRAYPAANSSKSLLGIDNLYHGKMGYDDLRLIICPCQLLVGHQGDFILCMVKRYNIEGLHMGKQISSNGLRKLLSLTDEALLLSDKLNGGIKGYKKTVMRQFLGIEERDDKFRWPMVLLGELAYDSGISEGPAEDSIYRAFYTNEGVPLLESKLLTELRLGAQVDRFLDERALAAFQQFVVRGGDILMVQQGDYAGASAVVPIFHPGGVLGPQCIRIRVSTDRCETFYLLNVLHFFYRDGVFDILRKGNATRIEIDSLAELQIPLPPLEDQKGITGTLLELSGALVAQEAYVDSILKLREVLERG
jgi:hypothetical protein